MQLIDICTKINHALLPQNCLLCGCMCGDSQLCSNCLQDLPYYRVSACPVCALPTTRSEVCGNCLKRIPKFDATIAALSFDFPADALIRALKYQGQVEIAQLLANIFVPGLSESSKPDLIIPMPLHTTRLRQRGFNQAVEIARCIAHLINIPFEVDTVFRVRATQPQAGLTLKIRKKNMRDAFATNRSFSGMKIAIVDDVITTGTSLDELAKTLKTAGATKVDCWVAARTLRD